MTDATFWDIINRFDWDKTGDDDAVLEPAVAALAAMSEADIRAFEDTLAAKLHALDTRAQAKACYAGEADPDDGNDYISPDDFLYCRCCVLANGQGLYDAVLQNPGEFPQGIEFESILYLAGTAYERKTGQEFDHDTPVSYESFENTQGWAATADTQPGKFTTEDLPPGNRRPAVRDGE